MLVPCGLATAYALCEVHGPKKVMLFLLGARASRPLIDLGRVLEHGSYGNVAVFLTEAGDVMVCEQKGIWALSGFEACAMADGTRYVGMHRGGQPHRQGVKEYADGPKYRGQFGPSRKEEGHGEKTYADGTRYVGDFADGKLHGDVTDIKANGTVSHATYVDGQLTQIYSLVHATGDRYKTKATSQSASEADSGHVEGTYTYVAGGQANIVRHDGALCVRPNDAPIHAIADERPHAMHAQALKFNHNEQWRALIEWHDAHTEALIEIAQTNYALLPFAQWAPKRDKLLLLEAMLEGVMACQAEQNSSTRQSLRAMAHLLGPAHTYSLVRDAQTHYTVDPRGESADLGSFIARTMLLKSTHYIGLTLSG